MAWASSGKQQRRTMRIDAHQHFWRFHPIQYEWITHEMKVIRRDFTPADLHPLLKESQLAGCVAVQSDQSENETLTLVQLAEQNDFIKGIVGWVDLMSANIHDRLTNFVQHKRIKGFRHVVQGQADGFLLQKNFLRGIASLAEFGFTYDVLIYPNQLPEAISFVQRFPDHKFVLDHLAKPYIKKGILEPWKKHIVELASFENVCCKLSGMVTEADWHNWKPDNFTPYLDIVLNSFGPKRVLYGSDWPVCLVASSYQQQLAIVENYIGRLSVAEKKAIMGDNAVQFYNL